MPPLRSANAGIARLSAGPIGNLNFICILWPQTLLPEFKQLLGQPGERILPAGLLLIDGAAWSERCSENANLISVRPLLTACL
jgi:hypothetical protein